MQIAWSADRTMDGEFNGSVTAICSTGSGMAIDASSGSASGTRAPAPAHAETSPAEPTYVASGTVAGSIHNRLSLDEKDGHLRITTTGSIAGLAPTEQIDSAHVVGDRGCAVTSRQVDPLVAVDLSDPANPKLLSELKIPGVSERTHPLECGTHLLTIGRDGTDSGAVTNPALHIFDVSDPLKPPSGSRGRPRGRFLGGRLRPPGVHRPSGDARDPVHSSLCSPISQDDDCSFGQWGVDVRRGLFIDGKVDSVSTGGGTDGGSRDDPPHSGVSRRPHDPPERPPSD